MHGAGRVKNATSLEIFKKEIKHWKAETSMWDL